MFKYTMKYKVLELISTMGEGGAESLVKDYALMINKGAFDISILTVYHVKHSTTIPSLEEAGISVKSILPGLNIFWKLVKWTIGTFYVPYKILNYIRENEICCVHVHMNQLHHLIPIMNKLDGVKIIYTVHNTPHKYFSGRSGRQEYKATQIFSKRSNFKLVALHADMASELSLMFKGSDVRVIENGVNFDKFISIDKTPANLRKDLGIPIDAYVIGHVGRFTEQKNHLFIVRVFKKILEKESKAFLLLIGSGPLRALVEDKLKDDSLRGRFLILEYRDDIPEIMRTMNVFLLPSLFEGLPITLIEAQVSKLPCVVSDNINKEAFLLPSTISMSLKESEEVWADTCLSSPPKIEWNDKILMYDMNNVIKKLENLYSE